MEINILVSLDTESHMEEEFISGVHQERNMKAASLMERKVGKGDGKREQLNRTDHMMRAKQFTMRAITWMT